MRVWIDVENPPQVQYLLPLKPALEARGAEVVVTARDYGNAFELLDAAGVEYAAIGASYGAGKARKVLGLAGRTRRLMAYFRRTGRPDASVSASRAAAVVSRALRRPSYVLIDYEHVSLGVFRLTRSRILHPDVIPSSAFTAKGVRDIDLVPFRGLKEDLSFAGIDVAATPAYPLEAPEGLVRILVRPAAEETHYYREESGAITVDLLARLARREDTVVVFAPRYPRQIEYLGRFSWTNEPVVLDRAAHFVSLLKSVDLVISSGGTMLREAAYLGIPAYSLFQGELGAVDRHLVEAGRLHLLEHQDDFERIVFETAAGLAPLHANPQLRDELAERVTSPDG